MAADKQFATLGIVLLAALARLVKATGLDLEVRADSQVTARRAITVSSHNEDRGERLARDEVDKPREDSLSKTTTRSVGRKSKDTTSKKAKATKRKKNAIDDLFSGLL